jgi:hypothetical protein
MPHAARGPGGAQPLRKTSRAIVATTPVPSPGINARLLIPAPPMPMKCRRLAHSLTRAPPWVTVGDAAGRIGLAQAAEAAAIAASRLVPKGREPGGKGPQLSSRSLRCPPAIQAALRPDGRRRNGGDEHRRPPARSSKIEPLGEHQVERQHR